MAGSPLDPLRRLFGEQLQELSGGVVSGEVPVTVGVINRLIAQKLATATVPILSAEVETAPDERFTVRLRPKGPIPQLTVDVTIDQQPEFPGKPYLGMHWSLRGVGPLAMLATPVIQHFKALPPGIAIDRDRIWVDLPALLRSQGAGELVPFVTGVRVRTQPARFVIQFELRR